MRRAPIYGLVSLLLAAFALQYPNDWTKAPLETFSSKNISLQNTFQTQAIVEPALPFLQAFASKAKIKAIRWAPLANPTERHKALQGLISGEFLLGRQTAAIKFVTPIVLMASLLNIPIAASEIAFPQGTSNTAVVSANGSPQDEAKKQILFEFFRSKEFTNYFDQGSDSGLLAKAREIDKKLDSKGAIENAMREFLQLAKNWDDKNKVSARQLLMSAVRSISPTSFIYLFYEEDLKNKRIVSRVIVMDVSFSETLSGEGGRQTFAVHGIRLDRTRYFKDAQSLSVGGGILLFFEDRLDESIRAIQQTIANREQLDFSTKIVEALGIMAEKLDAPALRSDRLRSAYAHEYAHEQVREGIARYAFNADPPLSEEDFHFGVENWYHLSAAEKEDIEQETAGYLAQVATVPEDQLWLLALEITDLEQKMLRGDKAAYFVLNRLVNRPRNLWVNYEDSRGRKQLEFDLMKAPLRTLLAARELLQRGYPGLQLIRRQTISAVLPGAHSPGNIRTHEKIPKETELPADGVHLIFTGSEFRAPLLEARKTFFQFADTESENFPELGNFSISEKRLIEWALLEIRKGVTKQASPLQRKAWQDLKNILESKRHGFIFIKGSPGAFLQGSEILRKRYGVEKNTLSLPVRALILNQPIIGERDEQLEHHIVLEGLAMQTRRTLLMDIVLLLSRRVATSELEARSLMVTILENISPLDQTVRDRIQFGPLEDDLLNGVMPRWKSAPRDTTVPQQLDTPEHLIGSAA